MMLPAATTHRLRQARALANRLLMTTLGVRVSSARESDFDRDWFDRLLYFQRLLEEVKHVPGDVVECGVFAGESLAMIANLLRSNGIQRPIWGFDSWAGFPTPSAQDLTAPGSLAERGGFSGVSEQHVLATLRRYGLSDAEIRSGIVLIQGFFADTLHRYTGTQVAFLHLDADLYQSHLDVLSRLWSKVGVGGIVALDDYHVVHEWPGAKQAVDEFLAQLAPGSATLRRDPLCERYFVVKTAP